MIKEIVWRLILPVCLLTPGVSTLTGKFLENYWYHLLLLLPRFAYFAVFLRGQLNLVKVLIAYVIEALAFCFIGWLFGRSIM